MTQRPIYSITIFDDGNQKYISYANVWVIIDEMFDGGKVKLQNALNKNIIISSISKWKIF